MSVLLDYRHNKIQRQFNCVMLSNICYPANDSDSSLFCDPNFNAEQSHILTLKVRCVTASGWRGLGLDPQKNLHPRFESGGEGFALVFIRSLLESKGYPSLWPQFEQKLAPSFLEPQLGQKFGLD